MPPSNQPFYALVQFNHYLIYGFICSLYISLSAPWIVLVKTYKHHMLTDTKKNINKY